MNVTLELIADICVDLAMAILLWKLIAKGGKPIPGSRLIAATFGIGFVAGTIAAGLRGAVPLVILDALGFMLSYTAFLFTFPGRKSEGGSK